MSHRWDLPKVAKWEVRNGVWDLDAADFLCEFLATSLAYSDFVALTR